MLTQLGIGALVIVATILFHVLGLVLLASTLRRIGAPEDVDHRWRSSSILLSVAVLCIVGIHTVEAWVWAALFLLLGEFATLSEALYLSVVTSTTLGYGDLTLSDQWKILGTCEAMGGLILFGASTAFLIRVMERLLLGQR